MMLGDIGDLLYPRAVMRRRAWRISMTYRTIALFGALILLAIIGIGCADGSSPSENPTTPVLTEPQNERQPSAEESGHVLWGFAQVYVNPDGEDGLEIEIIPLRIAEGHWNALRWLEQGPCTDCFKIVGINPTGSGTLECDIEISHPFPNPNLTGFDVRGIAMFAGSRHFPTLDLTIPDRDSGDGELVNADGYTALYNYATLGSGPDGLQGYIPGKFEGQPPTAQLNGYKRHISDDPANTRNAFLAGDAITVTYEIDMPDGAFVFGYAVDANWVKATNPPVTDPMTEFPPEANCIEPWMVELDVTLCGQGLTDLGDSCSFLWITVWDYEGKTSYEYPVVECPELFDGTLTATHVQDDTGWSEFKVDVYNPKHAAVGDYVCLVKVEETANAGSPEWLDLTAYQTTALHVAEFVNDLPVAAATAAPNPQTVCEPVHFSDDGSYDPDGGPIELYEWDWNNDGAYDETGDDVYHTWNVPDTYYVQFRVTDDDGTTGTLDDPLEIVIENELPTAVANVDKTEAGVGEAIEFYGAGSYDNDCGGQQIVKWEWDWENDGIWDTVAESTQKTFQQSGIYNVQLRVTDDEGSTNVLDLPLVITITETTWAITIGGSGGEYARSAGTDSFGNVYVVGRCHWGVDFDPGPDQTDPSTSGAFVAKYDRNGDYLWHHVFYNAGTWTHFYAVHVDSSDNVYMTGRFAGTIDFDPGSGIHEHACNGYSDVVLVKLDTSGEYLWSRAFGGNDVDQAYSMTATDSRIYIVGTFENTVDFDPFGGGEFRTALGDQDCFLTCFNLSGTLQWVNTWGGNDSGVYRDYARDVGADDFGNVYVTGSFHGTCDFDPSLNVVNRTSEGEIDAYLVGYNSSGNLMWVNAWGVDTSNYECGFGVTVDQTGYVYVVGRFEDTVDFDPGLGTANETSNGWYDAFLVQYDWNGDFGWVETWGSVSSLGREQADDVEVSDDGIVYVTGTFQELVDFDPGPGHADYQSAGAEDVFVLTMSTAGAFQWARGWGGDHEDGDWGCGVDFDGDGNVLVCGYFNGIADFDPGPGTDFRISDAYEDFFVSKFLEDGTW